jgi:aromatic-amino-acid transaminase
LFVGGIAAHTMLDRLTPQPPDALLALIKLHAADARPDAIDLGVGVYRSADGGTPVFAAIKTAEARLLETQTSKAYLGPEGDMGFVEALMPWVFGADATMGGRLQGMQAPGGTGAVRLALALAQQAGVTRVFLGVPSWPNHAQILADLRLETVPFAHAAPDGSANLGGVLAVIADAREGDVVILQGSCHNPTGVDYTAEQWAAIAAAFANSRAVPLIDMAYQGLGEGMAEDAAGMMQVLAAVPEALVAYSCDKNFGLYRDRVGVLYVLAREPGQLAAIMSHGSALARANWSMPPDHGAAAVRIVLEDEVLTAAWLDELRSMRERMRDVRLRLAAAGRIGAVDLISLGKQHGMFAMLPLNGAQIAALRVDHAIYMAGSGRINIAGLHAGNIDKFLAALAAVA